MVNGRRGLEPAGKNGPLNQAAHVATYCNAVRVQLSRGLKTIMGKVRPKDRLVTLAQFASVHLDQDAEELVRWFLRKSAKTKFSAKGIALLLPVAT